MNFLFFSGYETDKDKANYKIMKLIAAELIRCSHNVTVITVGAEDKSSYTDGIENIVIGNQRSKKLSHSHRSFISKWIHALDYQIQGLMQWRFFPDRDRVSSSKIICATKGNKKSFDLIIAFSKPYFNISALSRMRGINVPRFAYIFDLYDDIGNADEKTRKKNFVKYYKRDYLYLKKLDAVLVPPKGIIEYKKLFSEQRKPIVSCVDFPTLVSVGCTNIFEKRFQDDKKHFVIYGSLDYNYRNPTRLLDIIKRVSKPYNIEFDFFCRGCEKLVAQYSEYADCNMRIFPVVEYSELKEYICSADVLVNISNESNVMVPSKLFEMFAYGKPILDFSVDGNNSSKEYIDLYPSKKRIFSRTPFEESVLEFVQWFKSLDYAPISFEEIKKIYYKNTPEYVADKIIKLYKTVK